MEQTFDEQCKEDSRLAQKLVFVARNIFRLNPQIQTDSKDVTVEHIETQQVTKIEVDKQTKPVIFISVACSYCKAKFQRERRYVRKGRSNYCSGLCKDKASIDRCSVKLDCCACGTSFLMPKGHYNSAKNKDRICCSTACANRTRPRKAESIGLECTFCGTKFERKKRLHKEDRPCFCSVSCRAKDGWIKNGGLPKAAAAQTQERHQAGCP